MHTAGGQRSVMYLLEYTTGKVSCTIGYSRWSDDAPLPFHTCLVCTDRDVLLNKYCYNTSTVEGSFVLYRQTLFIKIFQYQDPI